MYWDGHICDIFPQNPLPIVNNEKKKQTYQNLGTFYNSSKLSSHENKQTNKGIAEKVVTEY